MWNCYLIFLEIMIFSAMFSINLSLPLNGGIPTYRPVNSETMSRHLSKIKMLLRYSSLFMLEQCSIAMVENVNVRVFPKQHKSDISGIFVQNWHHRVSKSAKIKLPLLGIELTTPTPPIRIPTALPIQSQRHVLNRRFMNWTWIISGSVEHDFIRFETGMDWQIGWFGI